MLMEKKQYCGYQLFVSFQEAIDRKQFQVYFQPKFDIRPDQPVLCGAEALVRWKHPELGMISPGIFVPLFESNGLVRDLDHYVWRGDANQMREWKQGLGRTVPVSVNVSRVDMMDPDLLETLNSLVDKAKDFAKSDTVTQFVGKVKDTAENSSAKVATSTAPRISST